MLIKNYVPVAKSHKQTVLSLPVESHDKQREPFWSNWSTLTGDVCFSREYLHAPKDNF